MGRRHHVVSVRGTVGDPHGAMALQALERRHPKIHFAGPRGAICSQRRAIRETPHEPSVTCRVCLYWLGLYVPIAKLREHQAFTRMRHDHAKGAPYAL